MEEAPKPCLTLKFKEAQARSEVLSAQDISLHPKNIVYEYIRSNEFYDSPLCERSHASSVPTQTVSGGLHCVLG